MVAGGITREIKEIKGKVLAILPHMLMSPLAGTSLDTRVRGSKRIYSI